MVIATWASRSFAFRMQAVSCEISARSENELSDGIYPSAIAQRVRPMASMSGEPPVTRALHQRRCGAEVPQKRRQPGTFRAFRRPSCGGFAACLPKPALRTRVHVENARDNGFTRRRKFGAAR